jgi:hypothetical protein
VGKIQEVESASNVRSGRIMVSWESDSARGDGGWLCAGTNFGGEKGAVVRAGGAEMHCF